MNQGNVEKGKVLIADDDDDGRSMLAFLLESEGWEIAEARDGKEAVEKVIAENPDVLILDNRMPELTGSEVYQCLRKRGSRVSVVLVTAYSDGRELASSLGIPYFIQKPVDFAALLAAVEGAIAQAKSQ